MRFLQVSQIAALSWLAQHAAAHGIVSSVVVASTKTYAGYQPDFQYSPTPVPAVGWITPENQDTGFILPSQYGSPDIICHKNAKVANSYADVKAGESIELHWTTWPESHHGPVMDYLAPAGDDFSKVDKTQLKFFKIDQAGMTSTASNPPLFASDDMIKNGNVWTVKIPVNLKPGNYVLRHETIALHEGDQQGKAQNYPQCINIKVSGSGTEQPAGVPATSLYSPTDPGIFFDIYKKYTDTSVYKIPGPAVGADGTTTQGSGTPVANVVAAAASSAPESSSSGSTGSTTTVPTTTTEGEEENEEYGSTPSSTTPSTTAESSSPPLTTGTGRKGRGRGRHGNRKHGNGRWWSGNGNQRRHARDITPA